MAKSTPVRKAWRSLSWLLVITLGLTALLGAGVLWGTASWAPKLALDLEGGTQIILAPQLEGEQEVTADQLSQAVSIIRQRIDASGVSEAEITTQGSGSGQKIVVSIPGVPDDETLSRIEASAKLEFRPVLVSEAAATSAVGEDGTETATPTPEPTPSVALNDVPTTSPTSASDLAYVTDALADQYTNFDCASEVAETTNVAPADEPLVTCDDLGQFKYILGPVEVSGDTISDATNSLVTTSAGVSTGEWGVNIVFDDEGTEQFAEVTERLFNLQGSQNQFAIVLDGRVISAPTTNAVISNGEPQISGNFTQETSKTLADQLKYGALPISFTTESTEVISSTLGDSQLRSGLIAGIIGLILVLIYSLFQYRLLGLVTMASLVVAGVLTYLVIAIMSWRYGYRLSLAGVAGLIVAIGFTADSFIVYFERIRDELRDGRNLVSSVEAGWKRALRTIYAAKAVNLLSAIVLYILAIGNVRGFALTLGLTTIIDVIIVVLFTHPMLQLMAQTRFFSSGHKLSGLDPDALGAVYRGRAQFRSPAITKTTPGATREAARRQTIAERKAGALTGAARDTHVDGKDS
ncbi:preprotein translocase subunit SecD [Glaciihabitans tibetensis]|uniref:Protein translocase subunit SecD n=1 Tax=Glaciihabitans tibetensis TaxID=1266600 RepID=A0A2T0VJH7_9MICO|nr:protein translocase subunit SecD [Glaciihabitans tibetensis]PRY70354.1 preprotein translocase subunit SecD [Glaciihabitans tibetensis]